MVKERLKSYRIICRGVPDRTVQAVDEQDAVHAWNAEMLIMPSKLVLKGTCWYYKGRAVNVEREKQQAFYVTNGFQFVKHWFGDRWERLTDFEPEKVNRVNVHVLTPKYNGSLEHQGREKLSEPMK